MARNLFLFIATVLGVFVLYSFSVVLKSNGFLGGNLAGVTNPAIKFIVQLSSFVPAAGEKPTDILMSGDVVAKAGEDNVRLYRILAYSSPKQDLDLRSMTFTQKGEKGMDVESVSVFLDNTLIGQNGFTDGKAPVSFGSAVRVVKNSVVPLDVRVKMSSKATRGNHVSLGFATKDDVSVTMAGGNQKVVPAEMFFCLNTPQCNVSGTEKDIEIVVE